MSATGVAADGEDVVDVVDVVDVMHVTHVGDAAWRRSRAGRARARRVLAIAAMAVAVAAGCVAPDQRAVAVEGPAATSPPEAVTTEPTGPPDAPAATTAPPATESVTTTTGPAAGAGMDVRAVLAPLRVDDGPAAAGYVRELFPHWLDVDGDGCDGREQALIAGSERPATVGRNCSVATGSWFSDYDGLRFTSPGELDVDHVVPLADAWRRGAHGWTTDQRARFANDPRNLWPVSATTNRSKSDATPDEWRPPRRESWCRYAFRWVDVKVAYGLAATTRERDALGQMLDTCTAVPALGPATAPTVSSAPPPTSPPAPPTTAAPAPPSAGEPYYANCAAARAAGAAPIRVGEPGYRPQLDGDKDGIACE